MYDFAINMKQSHLPLYAFMTQGGTILIYYS